MKRSAEKLGFCPFLVLRTPAGWARRARDREAGDEEKRGKAGEFYSSRSTR